MGDVTHRETIERLTRERDERAARIAALEAALWSSRIEHDSTCRRHQTLCVAADEPVKCGCRADAHNARIDAALAQLVERGP